MDFFGKLFTWCKRFLDEVVGEILDWLIGKRLLLLYVHIIGVDQEQAIPIFHSYLSVTNTQKHYLIQNEGK